MVLLLVVFTAFPASAALYKSYVFDAWGEAVPIPDPYVPVRVIFGSNIGVGEFKNPMDIVVAPDQTLYVVDTGNNRIVRLANDYTVLNIYNQFDNNGKKDTFSGPQSVFVTEKGHMYVSDTGNERIVHLDEQGRLVSIIGRPPEADTSSMFPKHFRFRPKKVAVDRAGRIYVVVENLYEGLMEIDHEGNFKGFVGAPRVTVSLWQYFWYSIGSEEQKSRMQLFLPTVFSSMHMDELGFVYTVVATGDVAEDLFVRKLNPSGQDVLRRKGSHPVVGDINIGTGEDKSPSRLVDVVGRQDEIYSVLDQQRGRIFTYDGNGNLLYVFGGLGQGVGLFLRPEAIVEYNGQLLVLDGRTSSITLFAPTTFALTVHKAIAEYNQGHFDEAAALWRQIITLCANYELAYSGVADSELSKGNYAEAMHYYKLANNKEGYSRAYYRYRRQYVTENFSKLMTVVLAVAALLYITGKLQLVSRIKQKYRASQLAAALASDRVQSKRWVSYLKRTWQALRYSIHVIFHPADGFWDLKHEKRGSVSAATILLILIVIAFIFTRQYTGFALNYSKIEELNIIMESLSVLIPFLLWCLVNWALTTLWDGKGRMKDIYVASAYALTPLFLVYIPATILSNYLTIEEGTFYYLFLAIGAVWTFALLFMATLVTHDYSVGMTFFTMIATVIGIGMVCFVGLLLFYVVDQVIQFAHELYVELTFRV